MSDPVRFALVAEGPTDKVVIEAAIRSILNDIPFIIQQLQPEESLAFLEPRASTGWGGVYRWCRKAVERSNGVLQSDVLFATYRILIVHLDADVADAEYAHAGIVSATNDLPCVQACPPPSATTDSLRSVLLRWLEMGDVPPGIVFCTPSKNTEAWVLRALYPDDIIVESGRLECYETPQNQLQAKPKKGRVVSGGKKHLAEYRARATEVCDSWAGVRTSCTEAERFSRDVETAYALIQPHPP